MLGLSIRILACLLVVGLFVAHHGNADGAGCKYRSRFYQVNQRWNITINRIPYRCKCKKNNPAHHVVECIVRDCHDKSRVSYLYGKECRCVDTDDDYIWKCT